MMDSMRRARLRKMHRQDQREAEAAHRRLGILRAQAIVASGFSLVLMLHAAYFMGAREWSSAVASGLAMLAVTALAALCWRQWRKLA